MSEPETAGGGPATHATHQAGADFRVTVERRGVEWVVLTHDGWLGMFESEFLARAAADVVERVLAAGHSPQDAECAVLLAALWHVDG